MPEITFSVNGEKQTVNFDYGDNLQQASEKFGDDVVFAIFSAKADILIQDKSRNMMKAGKSLEEVQAVLNNFKFGIRVPGEKKAKKDPVASFLSNFAKMTPEQKAQMVEMLKGQL